MGEEEKEDTISGIKTISHGTKSHGIRNEVSGIVRAPYGDRW